MQANARVTAFVFLTIAATLTAPRAQFGCTKGKGPDKDVQAAGTGIMVGGIVLLIDGVRRVATPPEGGIGQSVSDYYK